MSLRKLSRSQLRAWAIAHCRNEQGGKCSLCGENIDFTTRGNQTNYAVDHDHDTGEIRGVLHRSCNAAEGKVANAAGRWGAKSMKYSAIIPWLERMLQYLRKEGTGFMYPGHLTEEQRADKQRLARNTAAALRRARMKVKKGEASE